MTLLLDSPSQNTAEMSVVDRTFEPTREVRTMTATYNVAARRARAHGFDRAVMRVSLMMLLAARKHADRTVIGYEEHTRRHNESVAAQRREHGAATLIARVH